jgi:adenosylmethionine-8-amino-7-oxononanoate aminotransferase
MLNVALIHTGRRGFISLEESYHGNSLGGLSIGDSGKRERDQGPNTGAYQRMVVS